MLATLDISKAVDEHGNVIEPKVEFENPIFRYAAFVVCFMFVLPLSPTPVHLWCICTSTFVLDCLSSLYFAPYLGICIFICVVPSLTDLGPHFRPY